MDIQKILAELRQQRDEVGAVIEALERMSFHQAPRRGRPPKWLSRKRAPVTENNAGSLGNGTRALPAARNGSRVQQVFSANGK